MAHAHFRDKHKLPFRSFVHRNPCKLKHTLGDSQGDTTKLTIRCFRSYKTQNRSQLPCLGVHGDAANVGAWGIDDAMSFGQGPERILLGPRTHMSSAEGGDAWTLIPSRTQLHTEA